MSSAAVARVAHGRGASGTAYVVGERTALTAYHTIAGSGDDARIIFDDREDIAVTELWRDEALDVAVLEMASARPDTTPIPLVVGKPAQGDRWRTDGFPDGTLDTSMSADGTVTRSDGGVLLDEPTLQLFCHQTANGLPSVGFSGGPVLVFDANGRAAGSIGIVRAGIRSMYDSRDLERIGGVVFASPITTLLERFAALRDRPGVVVVDFERMLSGWEQRLAGLDPDQLLLLRRLAHVPPPGLSIERLAKLADRDIRTVEAGVAALETGGQVLRGGPGADAGQRLVAGGLGEYLRHAGDETPRDELARLAEELAVPMAEVAYLAGGTTWAGISRPPNLSFGDDREAASWFAANAADVRAVATALMHLGDHERGWPLARAAVVASLPSIIEGSRTELEPSLALLAAAPDVAHDQNVATMLGAQLVLRAGDPEDAERRLEALGTSLARAGDAHGSALAATLRSMAYVSLGRWGHVEGALGDAVVVLETVVEPRGLAQAILVEAQLATTRGDANASALHDRARSMFESTENRRLYADSLAILGQALAFSGQPGGADGIDPLGSLGGPGFDPVGAGPGAGRFALFGSVSGEASRAVDTLERSLAEWRDLGDARREAAVLLQLARVHASSGWSAQAVDSAESAVEITRRSGTPIERSNALVALGQALLGRSEFDRAAAVAAEVRRLAFDEPTATNADALDGDVALARGRPRAAIEHFVAVLDRNRRAGIVQSQLTSLLRLSVAHARAGDLESAEGCLDDASTLARRAVPGVGEFNVLLYRSQFFLANGLATRARDEADDAIDVAQRVDDLRSEAMALVAKAAALQALGRFRAALVEIEVAWSMLDGLDDDSGRAQCRVAEGYVALAMGDHLRAQRCLDDAVEAWQRTGDEQAVAVAQNFRASVLLASGMVELAGETFETVRAANKRLDNDVGEAWALYGKAFTQSDVGDVAKGSGTLRVARRGLRGSLLPTAEILFEYSESLMSRALGRSRNGADAQRRVVDAVDRIENREQRIAAWVAVCRSATGCADVSLTMKGLSELEMLDAAPGMLDQVRRSVGHAAAVANRPLLSTIAFDSALRPLGSPASVDELNSYNVAASIACRIGRFDLARRLQMAMEAAAQDADAMGALRDAAVLDEQISTFTSDQDRTVRARTRVKELTNSMGHDVFAGIVSINEAFGQASAKQAGRSSAAVDSSAVATARATAAANGAALLGAVAEALDQLLSANWRRTPRIEPVLAALESIDHPVPRANALLGIAEQWSGAGQASAALEAAKWGADEFARGGQNLLCLVGRLRAAMMIGHGDVVETNRHLDALWTGAQAFDDPVLLAALASARAAGAALVDPTARPPVEGVVERIEALDQPADRCLQRVNMAQAGAFWQSAPDFVRRQARIAAEEAADLGWVSGQIVALNVLSQLGDPESDRLAQQLQTDFVETVRAID